MVTRGELYNLVWSQPMTKVCGQFDVSSSYMARVCTLLNVPRPPMGYWAKLAVGKASAPEPLPDARPGDQLSWNAEGGPLPAVAADRPPAASNRRSRAKARVPVTDLHPLINGARAEFLRSRSVEHGGYLKPYKKLLPDLSSSAAQLDRVLRIVSKFYNELENCGARVVIAPGSQHWRCKRVDEREVLQTERRYSLHSSRAWSPMRPTIAFFDGAAIAIAVVEMSAEVTLRYVGGDYIRETEYQAKHRRYRYQHSFTTAAELPIGRVRVFASTTGGGIWSMNWQEKNEGTIEADLPRVAKEIREAIPLVVERAAEASRQAEIRRQEWQKAEDERRRAEDRRRVEESIKTSHAQLSQIIEHWRHRMSVEQFFDQLSNAIGRVPEAESIDLLERFRLAQELVGAADPLDFFKAWRTPTEIHRPMCPQPDGEPESDP